MCFCGGVDGEVKRKGGDGREGAHIISTHTAGIKLHACIACCTKDGGIVTSVWHFRAVEDFSKLSFFFL